jgi:two-component system chemotaxis sensor kinase CheA
VVQAASENGKHISAQFSLPQTLMVRDEIMDSLQTILIHLFRNAVFHGIEAPEDRVQRGKSETGVIRLSADVEGDHVILTLEDDGRGLSSRNPVKTPDLFSLESEPSDRVTENAALETSIYATTNVQTGLGIGLHIVQSKMSQLSGSIEINAQENQGTAVVLRLPRCHFLHLDEAMGA